MKRKVTLRDLDKLGACYMQRELFQETFPDGAYITEENLAKAEEAGLDVYWLITHAVNSPERRTFRRRDNTLIGKYLEDKITAKEMEDAEYREMKLALKTGWKKA